MHGRLDQWLASERSADGGSGERKQSEVKRTSPCESGETSWIAVESRVITQNPLLGEMAIARTSFAVCSCGHLLTMPAIVYSLFWGFDRFGLVFVPV